MGEKSFDNVLFRAVEHFFLLLAYDSMPDIINHQSVILCF